MATLQIANVVFCTDEAGFEARVGTAEARVPSAIYSERTYFKSRAFIAHALTFPVAGFEQELQTLYLSTDGPRLLYRATKDAADVIIRSARKTDATGVAAMHNDGRLVSVGALMPLKRNVDVLLDVLRRQADDTEGAEEVRAMLDSAR